MTINHLRAAFSIALAIVLAIILLPVAIRTTYSVWASSLLNQIAIVLLWISLFAWLALWVIFDAYESVSLGEAVSQRMTPLQQLGGYVMAVVLPVLFAGMMLSVANLAVFLAVFAAVVLMASIGDHLVIKGLVKQIISTDSQVDQPIVAYYMNRPHMILHCVQLFMIALAAAVYTFIVRVQGSGTEWLSYMILSVSIIINESVIWRWRIDRLKSHQAKKTEVRPRLRTIKKKRVGSS